MENNQLKFTKIRFFILLFLIIVGIVLCIDLGYIFYKTNFLDTFMPSFCSVSNLIDCDGVAQTSYALSFGVPNALWGILLYSVMLMLLFVDRIQIAFKNTIFDVFKNPKSYIATLGILSFAISMILAFISIYKIEKICVLCFMTYFINLFIALVAADLKSFFINDIKTTIVDFIDGAKNHFILFVVVLTAFILTLVYLEDSLILSPKLKKERAMKEFYADENKYAIKGNILGKENSKVTIKIYSDFNCPFCKVVNIMLHKLAKEEDVFIEEIQYPLDTSCNKKIGGTLGGHENSCLYSRYAIAAKKQGKYWGAADVLFYKHPYSEDMIIEEFKKARLNLDIEKLKSDANSPSVYSELIQDIEKTFSQNINGTPTIDINGVMYPGALPYEELKSKSVLAKKRAENN